MQEKEIKTAYQNDGTTATLHNSFIVKQDLNLFLMLNLLDFLEVPNDEECAILFKALKARLLQLSALPISAEIVCSYVAFECVPENMGKED